MIRPLGTAAATAAVLWLLDRVGRGALSPPPLTSLAELAAWLEQRDAAVAVFAVLRLLAVAMAWYVAATLILGVAASLLRSDRLARVAALVTLPALRRTIAGVAGLGLASTGALGAVSAATALTATPAVADPGTPFDAEETSSAPPAVPTERLVTVDVAATPTERLIVVDDASGGEAEATMTWVGADKARAPTDEAAPSPVAPRPAPPADIWVLEPGEHLWAVAESHLADVWGLAPTDAEVTAYWRRLVEHNRSRLPNPHDPDFVVPGLWVELPPPPPRPGRG